MTEDRSRARPPRHGRRRAWILAILLAALWAANGLSVTFGGLVPSGGGSSILSEFTGAALTPALSYESPVPEGTPALVWKVLDSMRRTLVFAAAGMSLALLIGFPLGLLASTVWWRERVSGESRKASLLGRVGASSLFVGLRTLIAFMRSVHELLWAVVLPRRLSA